MLYNLKRTSVRRHRRAQNRGGRGMPALATTWWGIAPLHPPQTACIARIARIARIAPHCTALHRIAPHCTHCTALHRNDITHLDSHWREAAATELFGLEFEGERHRIEQCVDASRKKLGKAKL
jgi:hypothetical protein